MRPYAGGGFGRSDNHMSSLKWHDTSSSGVLPGAEQRLGLAVLGRRERLPAGRPGSLEFGYRYMDMGSSRAAGPDLQGQFHGPGVGTGPASGRLRADEIFLQSAARF